MGADLFLSLESFKLRQTVKMQWFITNSSCSQMGFGFHDFDTLLKLKFILYPSQPARRDQISPTMHFSYHTHNICAYTTNVDRCFQLQKSTFIQRCKWRAKWKMHVLSVIGCLITGGTWPNWPSRNSGGNGNRTTWSKGKYSYPINILIFHRCTCCLYFLGFILFNIISAKSAGWHWIPRSAWSTWSSWNRWTRSSCEFNIFLLSWSFRWTIRRLFDLSTPLTFIYRDLKDRKVFKVVKDRQVKACLDPR